MCIVYTLAGTDIHPNDNQYFPCVTDYPGNQPTKHKKERTS